MKRVLGIEGGGTKTEWLFVDEDGVSRGGTLPSANLRLISDDALERLLRVLPPDSTHVGVFLAGCVNEADAARLRACAERVWPRARLAVGNDRQSGFAAAFGDGDGVAVIGGTGSAITGRRGDRVEKASGWGHLLGDKGSGYDLAVQALRHVLWNYDLTRSVTVPAQAILEKLALGRLQDLVAWAKDADKMSVARLAPVVFETAQADAAMSEILDGGARALADGACAVAHRLGLNAPEIKLQGGLFLHRPEYGDRFTRHMAKALPRAAVSVCRKSGAAGALWLAERLEESGRTPLTDAPPEQEPVVDVSEIAVALTEQINPRSLGLDTMSTPGVVDLFIEEESQVKEALARARVPLIAAVELLVDAFRKGGRLYYIGAGTSGRLGVLDASEIPPTFGTRPELVQAIMAGGVTALHRAVEGAEDESETGALTVLERGVRAGDVACGITASGRTPFVTGALRQARELGARTLLITCNPGRHRSGPPWDGEIDLETGPELLAGSTRLKAGTATKCALNILTTVAMVRLGRTEGNLMADVVVSNAKLRERAIRLVSVLRGLTRPQAEAVLEQNEWNVRRSCAGKMPVPARIGKIS